MNDPTSPTEDGLKAVFERLSQDSEVGRVPLGAIVTSGRRQRRTRRALLGLSAVAVATVLGGGGWLAAQANSAGTTATPMSPPAATTPKAPAIPRPSITTTKAPRTPQDPPFPIYRTFPEHSGKIAGVPWKLGLVHAGGGTSCTAVVAATGPDTGTAGMFGCDQQPANSDGGVSTTGYTIDAPSGHGSVGWVTIGQVSPSVKSVDCVWKGVHYSTPTFRLPGLTQTYFALGLPGTQGTDHSSEIKLRDAQGKEIGTAPF
ncbi:hypothetical protein G3I60_06625 [Streptomyces sp. SID13666]|uniref:hypothetical protein n=1 Tax=Streptomyces TaxID=1883 RepID=UPI0011059C5C|nr:MULTISPECIES: hypothetical protein [Streptomyces]MCZ4101886.1 hypothetical protein [Streptomyces sp. H39-C1]NEA53839.1 hypothetical protein [Streptomyces sp. SID13666]NEA75505.1 hypothetical protein [Streptomyces sp. SID13588]QNA76842.1 hypothetical protein C8250_037670 [Streptomyces sp. So13.3]